MFSEQLGIRQPHVQCELKSEAGRCGYVGIARSGRARLDPAGTSVVEQSENNPLPNTRHPKALSDITGRAVNNQRTIFCPNTGHQPSSCPSYRHEEPTSPGTCINLRTRRSQVRVLHHTAFPSLLVASSVALLAQGQMPRSSVKAGIGPACGRVGVSVASPKSCYIRPALHPGSWCCSSVAYSRYAPFSRLARRAHRRPRC